MVWLIATSVAFAFSLSLLIVPSVRSLARRVGLVDKPDGQRKLQQTPIALAGGLAVFITLVIAFAATLTIDRLSDLNALGVVSTQWAWLFGAAALILAVGMVDDAIALRGRQKLLLQLLIITGLVIFGGTTVEHLSVFGFQWELGGWGVPLTVFWLLLAVNALNLIDGADGMATTAGCIICAGLAILSFHQGALLSGIASATLSAALFGFLMFNRPPATIYLGDAGSMMIGLMVGVLAIWSNVKGSTALASAPVAILAIPLLDSAAAVVRRHLTGRSIYATDRAHLHHLLQQKYGLVGMLWVVAALCLTTTVMSIVSVVTGYHWLAGLGVFMAVGILVSTRSFGHSEVRLLLGRGRHFAHSFMSRGSADKVLISTHCLQGSGRWDKIWEPLVRFADLHGLLSLKIDLNLPWLHEGFHATWHSKQRSDKACRMTMKLPLFVHRGGEEPPLPIGRLEVIAAASDPTVYRQVSEFTDKLEDLGPMIDAIVAELEGRDDAGRETAPAKGSTVRPVDVSAPAVLARKEAASLRPGMGLQ